jgi:hypothetical protein
MTYSQGGTVEATDYNNRIANVNAIWGAGAGSNGYGQSSTLSNVTAGSGAIAAGTNSTNPQIYANAAAATNWAGLISRIDAIRLHQAGAASGLTQPVAGGTITFLSTLDANITACVTNKLTANIRGTAAPTALGNPAVSNASAWTSTAVKEISITFTSTDTVRYFFNSGGLLTTYAAVVSGTTTKATDWNTFLTNTVGTITLGSNYCSRSGTGGDNLTQNTGTGLQSLTTTYQTLFNIGSTSATSDYGLNSCLIEAKVGGALYGASSNVVYLKWTMTDSATDVLNDTVAGTTAVYAGYTPPETTYLANTWSTPGTAAIVTNTQT